MDNFPAIGDIVLDPNEKFADLDGENKFDLLLCDGTEVDELSHPELASKLQEVVTYGERLIHQIVPCRGAYTGIYDPEVDGCVTILIDGTVARTKDLSGNTRWTIPPQGGILPVRVGGDWRTVYVWYDNGELLAYDSYSGARVPALDNHISIREEGGAYADAPGYRRWEGDVVLDVANSKIVRKEEGAIVEDIPIKELDGDIVESITFNEILYATSGGFSAEFSNYIVILTKDGRWLHSVNIHPRWETLLSTLPSHTSNIIEGMQSDSDFKLTLSVDVASQQNNNNGFFYTSKGVTTIISDGLGHLDSALALEPGYYVVDACMSQLGGTYGDSRILLSNGIETLSVWGSPFDSPQVKGTIPYGMQPRIISSGISARHVIADFKNPDVNVVEMNMNFEINGRGKKHPHTRQEIPGIKGKYVPRIDSPDPACPYRIVADLTGGA